MKRIATAAFLLACLVLHARPALADTYKFTISADRQTAIINGIAHTLAPKPAEAYYAVKGGGVAAMYLNASGLPGIPDQGNSFMVADSFGCGVQCLTFDSSNNLDVNVTAGTITLNGGNNVIGGVFLIPKLQAFGSNTETLVDVDFAVNQATCTAITAYPNGTPGVPNTGHYCWIIKGTNGELLRVTWGSLNNMNTLKASTSVTCFDSATTNSGNIVVQGSFGAGQYLMYQPYGRPFKNGLTCISNNTNFGTAAIDYMEFEIL